MEIAYSNKDSFTVAVEEPADVSVVKLKARDKARKLGFSEVGAEQIAIAAIELAENLVKHRCIDGRITISCLSLGKYHAIEIVATDVGPGIASVETVLRDGASSAGTMGCGLGAVKRLMDDFEIMSSTESFDSYIKQGTIIVARKWLVRPKKTVNFSVGAASRPFPDFINNGDAFYAAQNGKQIFVAVVDGLGHGKEAEEASQAVINSLDGLIDAPFEESFPVLNNVLRGTRGAVMTAVRLDEEKREFSHASVGNVEIRIAPYMKHTPVTRPGIMGRHKIDNLAVHNYSWPRKGVLVMYSDGVRGGWDLQKNSELLSHSPSVIAHYLIRHYGRDHDDATALVIKES